MCGRVGRSLSHHHLSAVLTLAVARELLEKYGVRLQVLGQTSLLPQHVRDAVKKAEMLTRRHDR